MAIKKNDAKKPSVKSGTETPAAKKPVTKAAAKPAAKKTAVKSTAKTTAVKATAAKKTASAAKKGGRKPKPVTVETICGLVAKKISKTKAAAVKVPVAVDIEVWGFEDGSNQKMYIEVRDGNVSVMPHTYDAKDFRVSLSFANAMDFANGKITLAKLLESNDFYAEGNIVAALTLASIF